MRELQAAYRRNLPELIDALEAAASGVRIDASGADEEVHRVAHQLKGSGGSYGFPEVSRAAAAVLVDDGSAGLAAIDELLEIMRLIEAGEAAATARVLLIDDDPLIRHLVGATLSSGPYEVVEAATFAAARAHLADQVDLIILDLFLPDGDGREILSVLRSDPQTAAVPIVVLSGELAEHARAECLRLGASAFVEKPFDAVAFAKQVADLLEGGAEEAASHSSAPFDRSGDHVPHVLVAEDDELSAGLVVDRLQRDGLEVTHAPNGLEALRAAEAGVFDLVILDVKMPFMDGFQLLTELRGMERYRDAPIIFLSAMGSEHSVVRAFDLGASDYILKPFSPTELTVRVERLLGW